MIHYTDNKAGENLSYTSTVLLIEDDEAHAHLVRRSFHPRKTSLELHVVESLGEARDFIAEKNPDLVILDYLLPDGSGIDFLREMDTADFAIIVITSHGDETLAVDAMKAGALDYVVKSDITLLDMAHIAERALREWLQIKTIRHAEQEKNKSLTKLNETLEGIINAMALTIEARDPYTAGHQKKVALLAEAIGHTLGLPAEMVQAIRMAGLIHDLGKIYVPSEILTKPGRISEAEFDIIKTHPTVGYDILKTIDFRWPIADIVHQHHERMNGTGYPRGLGEDQIRLEARIISVADVVEAMATHRPYRESLGRETAVSEISRNRSILYDPDVVDALFDYMNSEGESFNRILFPPGNS